MSCALWPTYAICRSGCACNLFWSRGAEEELFKVASLKLSFCRWDGDWIAYLDGMFQVQATLTLRHRIFLRASLKGNVPSDAVHSWSIVGFGSLHKRLVFCTLPWLV